MLLAPAAECRWPFRWLLLPPPRNDASTPSAAEPKLDRLLGADASAGLLAARFSLLIMSLAPLFMERPSSFQFSDSSLNVPPKSGAPLLECKGALSQVLPAADELPPPGAPLLLRPKRLRLLLLLPPPEPSPHSRSMVLPLLLAPPPAPPRRRTESAEGPFALGANAPEEERCMSSTSPGASPHMLPARLEGPDEEWWEPKSGP